MNEEWVVDIKATLVWVSTLPEFVCEELVVETLHVPLDVGVGPINPELALKVSRDCPRGTDECPTPGTTDRALIRSSRTVREQS